MAVEAYKRIGESAASNLPQVANRIRYGYGCGGVRYGTGFFRTRTPYSPRPRPFVNDNEINQPFPSTHRCFGAVVVLFVLPGQSEKTSYQIFVFSLLLGIVNLIRFLAKHLSQPSTIGAWVHGP
jgi:hypothetical protein